MGTLGLWGGSATVLAGILIASFIILLSKRFKRCPSNQVMVIYGKVGGGNTSKCIHGGAAFVIPLLQDYAYISLEPMQIEVPLKDALSLENIRVNVPSVFTVAVGTTPELMTNAAIRLLGLPMPAIKKQAEDIIFGQLRQVVASLKIDEINRDRENFLSKVQTSLDPELRKIGLVLINVNITDITDSSGYIEAIGRKAASQAIQQARADVAEQEKLGEVRVAENVREKEVQVAEANRSRVIGIKSAEREQAVKIAELAKEQSVGEQQAAFSRDMQVKTAEQEMRINVAGADAAAITGENEAKMRVVASNADLRVKEAEAYQLAETRSEQAKAGVLEAKYMALAKSAEAQAIKVEAETRASLEAVAKGEKAKVIVDAEAEAEKRRIEAEGEAKAIFAKLEAEARGTFQILQQKGRGMSEIIKACGGAKEAFQILLLEHLDRLAETSAKAIANIKFDKIVVWDSGSGHGSSQTANFLNSMARVMPPMLQTMKDIGGIEIPEALTRLAGTSTPAEAEAPAPAPKKDNPPA